MRSLIVFSAAAALCGVMMWAWAGGAAAQDEQGKSAQEAFAEKFWRYLQREDYRENWKPWPGKTDDFYPGQAPHGAFLKLYVNDAVVRSPEQPPTGSIIIKENFGEDKQELMAITIMYRARDFNPEHDNWWWVKYTADGAVDKMGDMALAGKVQGCIDCHATAQGDDYVFTNDPARE